MYGSKKQNQSNYIHQNRSEGGAICMTGTNIVSQRWP